MQSDLSCQPHFGCISTREIRLYQNYILCSNELEHLKCLQWLSHSYNNTLRCNSLFEAFFFLLFHILNYVLSMLLTTLLIHTDKLYKHIYLNNLFAQCVLLDMTIHSPICFPPSFNLNFRKFMLILAMSIYHVYFLQ